MLRRFGAIAGVAAASLAFAASAHAAPSTPTLKPIPSFLCGSSVNLSWAASTPDPGAVIVQYRVDIGDLTAGSSAYKWVPGHSTTIGGLIHNHHYVVRVRALEFKSGALIWSATSARTFYATCLRIDPARLAGYVAYNPWPGCIMCGGLEQMQIDDPVILKAVSTATLPAADRIKGLQLEADGSVREM
jgi:hypothetical protein